jgi:geranyl-CoA carboxylase alpha subunit
LNTNRAFLIGMLRHPAFVTGEATTAFIEQYFPASSEAMRRPKPDARTLALAAVLLFEARARETATAPASMLHWFSTGIAVWPVRLTLGDDHHPASVMAVAPDHFAVAIDSETIDISIVERQAGSVRFTAFGLQQTARFAVRDGVLYLAFDGVTVTVRETGLDATASGRRDGSSRLVAPMNGAIISVFAQPGDCVVRGQRIVVLEAMKMQHEISAERDGTIGKILVKPGDQVATRQLLVELEPGASAGQSRTEGTP